jgi:hypothetical protein
MDSEVSIERYVTMRNRDHKLLMLIGLVIFFRSLRFAAINQQAALYSSAAATQQCRASLAVATCESSPRFMEQRAAESASRFRFRYPKGN